MQNIFSLFLLKRRYIIYVFLTLGLFFVFFTYHFNFIADDLIILRAVQLHPFPILSDWEHLTNGMYRPLISLSYFVNYKLFGYNPFPFYLFNIFLHILNSYLVFLLFEQLLMIINYKNNKPYSIFSGFIFFMLPQNLMNIMWIPGRSDILAGTFTFSSLYFFISYINSNKNYFLILTIILGIFAYASKETALLLNIYMLLILGFFFIQNKKVSYKKIILPYFILTFIYSIFRFLIFGTQLFGDSKLISLNIFSIIKFIFYGFWCLWFPIDLLDVYYFFFKSSYLFIVLIIPCIIMFFFIVKSLFHKSKTTNLKLGLFVAFLSVLSLSIYLGNYPQMRLMYIHLPLMIISLILIIGEIKTSPKIKTLFLVSYVFLISFGVLSVLFRSEQINNYYNELYSVVKKTKAIKNAQFLFCPTLGRVGQSRAEPEVESIPGLVFNKNLSIPSYNYRKLLSYDIYSFADYRDVIEYKILNSEQFIVKIKNGEGVITPEASKSFKEINGSFSVINYFKGITVFPFESKNYREGKPTACLINISPTINRKNTYIVIWENKHLILQSLETFFNK